MIDALNGGRLWLNAGSCIRGSPAALHTGGYGGYAPVVHEQGLVHLGPATTRFATRAPGRRPGSDSHVRPATPEPSAAECQ